MSELSTLTDLNTAVKPEVVVGIEGDVSLVASVMLVMSISEHSLEPSILHYL